MSGIVTKSTLSSLGALSQVIADDLNVVTPTGGNIIFAGGANMSSTGSGSTLTYALTGTTDHGVQIGNVTGSLTSLLGTTNTALLGVTGSNPIFGTVPNATLTNSSVTLNSGNNVTVTGSPLSLGGAATFSLSGTTTNALQIGNASGALTSLSIGLTNTVLLGSTGAAPSFGQVPNAALVNNDITLNVGDNIAVIGSPISLGSAGTIALSGMTEDALHIGNASGSLTSLGVANDGEIPIGDTGGSPLLATISSSSNITVVNGANSITVNLNSNVSIDTLTLTTPLSVPNGGIGTNTLTNHGILVGSSTGPVTALGSATDGQLPIGSTGVDPVLGTITAGRASEVTNTAGSITVGLTQNDETTTVHGWNGAVIEAPVVTVTSDGATITLSVEKSGGGNLTAVFSDGYYDWITPPATIALTAGSDTSPQINYIYLLQSTKTLTSSTVSFPSAEFAPIATVLCQSAASVQTDGVYKMHAWTDHIDGSLERGHISHVSEWIRNQNATWTSGVNPTLTITPSGVDADSVIFTSASGTVLQLHSHTFPAFSGTPDVYTVNDSVTPYNIVTDLNALLTDSTGGSMTNKRFSLVIWGVVSEDASDSKLMVNLPGGSYNSNAALLADASKFSDFSMPTDFVGTGFLIAQLNLRHQNAASGTWTEISTVDLRGLFPGTAAGGSTAAQTEFVDNTFRILDDGDSTKEIAFEASGITTITTRTITMADRDVDLDRVMPTLETAIGLTMVVNTKYIANAGIGVTLTLPVTIAQGETVTVLGKGGGGWTVGQNAGQTIHDVAGDTTTGVGGSYASSNRYDTVTLECITADTDFVVVSSKGVPTIT